MKLSPTKAASAASSPLPIFIFLGWALLLLVGYYYYHKPITPDQVAGPLRAFLDASLSFLILLVSGGVGRRLLNPPHWGSLERMAVQAGTGLGLFSLLWLALGAMGLYRGWAAWLVLLGWLAFTWRDCAAWLQEFKSLKGFWSCLSGNEKSLAVLGAALVANQAWLALAPPLKWDALAYHLELPHQYIAAGRLVFLPQNPYWGQPQLVEMINTWAMLLRGAETASFIGYWTGLLVLLGTAGLARTLFLGLSDPQGQLESTSREKRAASAALFAGIAILAGTTFRQMLAWAYTDLFAALIGLAALAVFLEWLKDGSPAWLRWMGVFIGFVVSVKWTAGVLALGFFPAAVWISRRKSIPWAVLAQAAGLAILVYLPWAVRSLLATGNPLFPIFFPTTWYSAQRLALANLPPDGVNWLVQLFLPVTITWQGIDSAAGFSTDIGPLLVLFAIPGLWRYRQDTRIRVIILGLLLTWLSIALLGARLGHLAQPRLYFAILPALGMAAGLGWESVTGIVRNGVRLRTIAGALALLVLILCLWQDSVDLARRGAPQVVLGITSRQDYLNQNLGWYGETMRNLGELPTEARVLFLWEPRGYYAASSAQADPWIDRWRVDRAEIGDPQEILTSWKTQGFSHILVYQDGVDQLRGADPSVTADDWQALDQLLGSLPSPTVYGTSYELYSLSQSQ